MGKPHTRARTDRVEMHQIKNKTSPMESLKWQHETWQTPCCAQGTWAPCCPLCPSSVTSSPIFDLCLCRCLQDSRATLIECAAGATLSVPPPPNLCRICVHSVSNSCVAVRRTAERRWRSALQAPWRRWRRRPGRSSWRSAGGPRPGRRCGSCWPGSPSPDREHLLTLPLTVE